MPPEEESEQTLSLWREIHAPCDSGSLEEVARLLEVNPGLARQRNGDTPLHTACWRGWASIVQLLLDKGAVIDAPDRWGCTALYWAAFSGHHAIVDLLLTSGADPTIRNQQGWNALMSSASRGHAAVVSSLLLRHRGCGEAINERDKDGQTALFRAAYAGHDVVVSILLRAGADGRLLDRHGRGPGDVASSNGHDRCCRLLQEWERGWVLHKARTVLLWSRLAQLQNGTGHRWGLPRGGRGVEALPSLVLNQSSHEEEEEEEVLRAALWWAVEEANDDVYHELMDLHV